MLYKQNSDLCVETNNFKKSLAASDAILRLVANVGVVRLGEITRIFKPQDGAWSMEVQSKTVSLLAYLYANSAQAVEQACPSPALLGALGAVPNLSSSLAKRVMASDAARAKRTAKILENVVSKRVYVDLATGRKQTRVTKVAVPVLEAHWLRTRSLASEWLNNSATVMATRAINRLVADGLLIADRGELGGCLYSLAPNGALALGPLYANWAQRDVRAAAQSAHKTLARGYILAAVGDATDAWSEGALFSKKLLPGVLGTPGLVNHDSFKAGHPADGIVLSRIGGNAIQETWGIELVEAERGNKLAENFLRGLALLEFGKNPDSFVKANVTVNGQFLRRDVFIKKLTYVMSSEEFVTTILRACRQFVTGQSQDKAGYWVDTPGRVFSGSGLWQGDANQGRWEELLSMIDIALCPLSPVYKSFLGVSYKASLLDYATERGLLDYRVVS